MNQINNQGKSTVTANYLSNIDRQLTQQTLIVPHLIWEFVFAPQTGCRTLDHSHPALICLCSLTSRFRMHIFCLCREKKDISLPDGSLMGKLWQAFISDDLFWMFTISYNLSKNSLQHVKNALWLVYSHLWWNPHWENKKSNLENVSDECFRSWLEWNWHLNCSLTHHRPNIMMLLYMETWTMS